MRLPVSAVLLAAVFPMAGCARWVIDDSDRNVYGLIESRQHAALGVTSDIDLGHEPGEPVVTERMYEFAPHPLKSTLPEAFRATPPDTAEVIEEDTELPPEADEPADKPKEEMSPSIFSDEQRADVVVFGLREALAYGMRHARELQDAKEDLYVAALDLSLERHLWTPQFVADITADLNGTQNKSRVEGGDAEAATNQLDRAMTAISTLAVSQQMPWGGKITATAIHRLMREVQDQVDEGSSTELILAADIPLFSGAGRVAYETRYARERALIYAVRSYERFRRTFAVGIASDYLDLQRTRAAIDNTFKAYESRQREWEKAEFIHRVGQSKDIFQVPRVRSSFRSAEADMFRAKERYETALDRFKIRIAMPVDALLDVMDQDQDEAGNTLDTLLPDVTEAIAVEVAGKYRLDLLNTADAVDDVRRGVAIAKNSILPELNVTGSVSIDSDSTGDSGTLGNVNFRHDRTNWQAGLVLSMSDRQTERNAYRATLVNLRRSRRDYELALENVRADVRRAIRRIVQQEKTRAIQRINVKENEQRLEAARAQYDLGKSTNQDVVDTENELLLARNDFAAAVTAYRIAILRFRLDTGTLRVTDEGRWERPGAPGEP